ncbi:hypothetical protein D9756_003355 [Leucocoprinus leucothites]|uniref:Uncharacterized protein n=1 Tax=Leucocoprinus leucothites TaxID=201217 RepID=A0A8H5LIX7_9AGAR|nr:hypothetical protein D9756_003355 [Leucoagaricus leucothites]
MSMQMALRSRIFQLSPRSKQMILTANAPPSYLLQQSYLFLAALIPFITVQSDYHRDITAHNQLIKQAFLTTGSSPAVEFLVEDELNGRDGTGTIKSAKVRALFQWGSRVHKAPRPSGSPAPGKGKPEDSSSDKKFSPSHRSSEESTKTSTSGSSSMTSNTRWSSKSTRSDDHDCGPDWDW